jgi:hypothetical protein
MQAKRKEQKGGWAAQKRTLKRAPSRALSSFGSGATGPRDMARNSRPRKSHAMPPPPSSPRGRRGSTVLVK